MVNSSAYPVFTLRCLPDTSVLRLRELVFVISREKEYRHSPGRPCRALFMAQFFVIHSP